MVDVSRDLRFESEYVENPFLTLVDFDPFVRHSFRVVLRVDDIDFDPAEYFDNDSRTVQPPGGISPSLDVWDSD